jgi:hypothetical protein
MNLRHPFAWLSGPAQQRAFPPLLVLTLAVMVSLQGLGGPLQTAAAPLGIVSFELAGTLPAARSMVESWGARAQVYAGLNLGLDYLFIVAYASTIGLGCVLVARSLAGRFRVLYPVGAVLAWALLAAGLLDALENVALIRILLGSPSAAWPAIARWCAIPKFLLVAAGLVYVATGVVIALAARARKGGESWTGSKNPGREVR